MTCFAFITLNYTVSTSSSKSKTSPSLLCRMDMNRLATATLFIFILVSNSSSSSSSYASFDFTHRKFIDTATPSGPTNTSTDSQVSPAHSPVNESDANPINAKKQNDSSDGLGKKKIDNAKSVTPSPPAAEKIPNQSNEGNKDAGTLQLGDDGTTCDGSLTSCRDKGMIACTQASKHGSSKMFLVVVNEGESTLTVNVMLPNALENALPAFKVPKHKTRKVYMTSTVGKSTELIVDAKNQKCVLPLVHPISIDKFVEQLSFYSRQVTPIYAAYIFFVLALVFGGTWACCKLSKRSRHEGIPYQELEMGLPESAPAVTSHATEGWEHDWDDDWDEDNAVKSPGGGRVKNISADGLTSRSSKIDGWENDWDD